MARSGEAAAPDEEEKGQRWLGGGRENVDDEDRGEGGGEEKCELGLGSLSPVVLNDSASI